MRKENALSLLIKDTFVLLSISTHLVIRSVKEGRITVIWRRT